MKRIGLIGLIALSTAGCGQGWSPFRPFRGAPCRMNAPCINPLQGNYNGCNGCGSITGYPNYDGTGIDEVVGGSGYYGGEIISDGAIIGGTTAPGNSGTFAPPMRTIPSN